jgi:hypothetical protein
VTRVELTTPGLLTHTPHSTQSLFQDLLDDTRIMLTPSTLLGRRRVLPNATIDFLMSGSSSGGGASGGGAPTALCGKEASAVDGDEAPVLGTVECHAVWIEDALAEL